jgi:predicted metal-dependent phosphoesterase TrpH
MKFELHCHSWHSEGRNIPTEGLTSPKDIVRILKKRGFSGVAITDHDTTKGWKEAESEARKHGLVFIPGLEVSTASGHLIGLGLTAGIKSGMSIEESIEKIHDQGGIAVSPHPFDLRAEGIGKEFRKCDAAETFNSLILTRIENIIARREVAKTSVSAVGGSDAHTPAMLGLTANIIDAGDPEEALSRIKKGRVRIYGKYAPIPEVVSWARKRMKASNEDVLRYIDRNYSRPKAALARVMLSSFLRSESPAWNGLGYIAVGISTGYSALKAAFT